MKPSFMITAPTSGSGKTTIARGLMALLTAKGYTVQPFKCGPDYIDTKFHTAVCGRPSINLDTFMATPKHVSSLFLRYGQDADMCVVEGMMGLYDGYDRDRGSSAEIARLLGLPVVLVVDARSAAYSVAPLLHGFATFRSDVPLAGVIFNKVSSERHFKLLHQVCDDLHISCFGYVPKRRELEQGSRYLGLDFSEDVEQAELVRQLEATVDWKALCRLGVSCAQMAASNQGSDTRQQTPTFKAANSDFQGSKLRVLMAGNEESFSFFYQEVVDSFAHVKFFDPETEVPQLDDTDLLYLPGGYPEKHLEALVANEACRTAVKNYAERGGRIQAECGGMMYLCNCMVDDTGEYPMCGVLPYTITARKADRRLSLGYRRFVLDGREYRGHEFHYTQFLVRHGSSTECAVGTPQSVAQVFNAQGDPVPTPVLRYKNVLASYTHLYQI